MYKASRIPGWFDYGGILLVPVELNGSVFTFMVDSGAAYCAINRKLLDKIVAEPADLKLSLAPLGKKIVTVSTLKIENFVVGDKVQKNALLAIVNCPEELKIDGLLGMSFMGKYRITIETDTATLVLREIKKK